MSSVDIQTVLPELILAVYAMVALLGAVYTSKDGLAKPITWITGAVMVLVALMVAGGDGNTAAFGGMFLDDAYSRFAKVAILLAAAAVLVMGEATMSRRGLLKFEYPILVTLGTVGMMVMVSAGDLMTLYMGLELQSLSLYVVASLNRDSVKSTEAGLKYFVLGALVLGFAAVRFIAGLWLFGHHAVLGYYRGCKPRSGWPWPSYRSGVCDRRSGLQSLGRAVPHVDPGRLRRARRPRSPRSSPLRRNWPRWACSPVWLFDAFGQAVGDWQQIIALLAVLSMFLGAVAAIGQTNIKRLMAFSSIAHMGFALLGLAAGSEYGVQAMLLVHGCLPDHEHRHFCLHHVDGA